MTDNINEKISGLMDEGVTGSEDQFLLRRLYADDQLKQVWSRYHVIGAAMRHENINIDIASNVSAAIAAEAQDAVEHPIVAPTQSAAAAMAQSKQSWFKPVAGFALAASVTAVAVTLWQNPSLTTGNGVTTAALTTKATTEPASLVASSHTPKVKHVNWQPAGPEARRRMNSYFMNHAEYGATGANKGMLQYVRLVSDRQEGQQK